MKKENIKKYVTPCTFVYLQCKVIPKLQLNMQLVMCGYLTIILRNRAEYRLKSDDIPRD